MFSGFPVMLFWFFMCLLLVMFSFISTGQVIDWDDCILIMSSATATFATTNIAVNMHAYCVHASKTFNHLLLFKNCKRCIEL